MPAGDDRLLISAEMEGTIVSLGDTIRTEGEKIDREEGSRGILKILIVPTDRKTNPDVLWHEPLDDVKDYVIFIALTSFLREREYVRVMPQPGEFPAMLPGLRLLAAEIPSSPPSGLSWDMLSSSPPQAQRLGQHAGLASVLVVPGVRHEFFLLPSKEGNA